MERTQKRLLENPLVNKAINFHTIEYQQQRDDDLFMKSCGIQKCLPDHAYPRCAREGYHLHVVLSGKGRYWVGNQCFHIRAGQMFLLKDMEEVFYQADSADPWHYVWVTYGGKQAKDYMEMAGFTGGTYVLDSGKDTTDFMNLVLEILKRQHMRVSTEVCRWGLAIQYLSLAIESWEQDNAAQSKRNDLTPADYVQYAVKFIRSNYQHVRISEVAEYIGINRTYLTEIFKERMFMSPQEYLLQVRMSKSKELLQQKNITIGMVANEVGYDDQMTFSKVFKKRFGISPSDYRRQLQL